MESRLSAFLRLVRRALLIDAGIFLVAGLVCWLGGWRSGYFYGNGVILGGAAVFLLGTTSVLGAWSVRGHTRYNWGRSIATWNLGERIGQDFQDLQRSYAFALTTALAGLVAIVAGIAIHWLLGYLG